MRILVWSRIGTIIKKIKIPGILYITLKTIPPFGFAYVLKVTTHMFFSIQ